MAQIELQNCTIVFHKLLSKSQVFVTLWNELFPCLPTDVLDLCYEPQCQKRFSVLCSQKSLPCALNHSVTRDFLFCVDTSLYPVLWTTVSQEVFCSVLTQGFTLCSEPQCHKSFSVLCWQKALPCALNHSVTRAFLLCWQKALPCAFNQSVTRAFLFCVDTRLYPVLWTTVSQELLCSVLTEGFTLCFEPQCHKRFSVLRWQKPLPCVMNHSVTRGFLLSVDRSLYPVLWTTVSQEVSCSELTEVFTLCLNHSVTRGFLFCADRCLYPVLWTTVSQEVLCSVLTEAFTLCFEQQCHKRFPVLCWQKSLPCAWTTVSQEVSCSVLTEAFTLCYEPQCHKRFSALCWQKPLPCALNHSVTRGFLFCIDRSLYPVLEPQCHKRFPVLCWQKSLPCVWTTVSQEVFCSVLTEAFTLCFEPQCHKWFLVLCWQKSLPCVMNHSVIRGFLFCVDRSPCPVLWTKVPRLSSLYDQL